MGFKSAAKIEMRTDLLRVQRGHCGLCGLPIEHPLDVTRDHVIPLAAGGANSMGNFLASHWRCNNQKSDRPPTGCEILMLLTVNARLGIEPLFVRDMVRVRPAVRHYLVLA